MNVYLNRHKTEDLTEPIHTPHASLAVQFALSLDHVVEIILRKLNTTQLLKCRLLSCRWNILASDFIRKRVEIEFYNKLHSTRDNPAKYEDIIYKKLIQLDSLPLSPQSPSPFPVCNFTFHFVDIYDSRVTHFLNIHGPYIQELALQSCVKRSEAELMDFVATLLSKQTRNLKILTLSVRAKNIYWKKNANGQDDDEDFERSVLSSSPMLPQDPEFFEIYSCVQYENPCSKLRVLRIDFEVSAKIFEVICRMSPRLEEIVLSSLYAAFLATPLSRAHVFKTFCSSGWKRFFEKEEELLEILKFLNAKNRLKLRTIVLRFNDVSSSYQKSIGWKYLVNVINYLFESSSNSVESLGWINMGQIKDGRIIWRPMCNLKKLTLGHYTDGRFSLPLGHIFPIGFSPIKIFPQLETVQLCIHSKSANLLDFLNSLNLEPVKSVKVVDVRNEPADAIITAERRIIRNLFPFARIITGKSCTRDPNLFLQCSC